MKLAQLKRAVETNVFGRECVVHSIHLRTDRIRVLNHTFREPVSLEYARRVVGRLVRDHTVWNCKLYSPTQGHWPL